MKRFRGVLALAAVAALMAAACGGSSKSSKTSAGGSTAGKEPAAVPGFDPATKTIHLGVITPLTGSVAVIGVPLTAGTQVWFDHVNKDLGGIAGKYQVKLDVQDSQYVPATGVQEYQQLKNSVVMFAQVLGTPVTKAILPQLKTDGMVAAPASLDADWVRDPNLLPVGGPYQIQMINAADYLLNEGGMKGKTFCSEIQDDAYGQAGQQGIDFAATNMNFTVKTTAKHQSGAADFTAQVQQLKSANCDVVFLVSTPADTGKILGTAAQLQFAPQWVGQSPSYIGALSQSALKDYMAAHFLLVSEGTDWNDTSVPGQKELLDAIAKFKPDQQPDYYFGFGYYEAEGVTQVLNKAVALGDLSHAGIMKAMEQVGTLTFNGLSGDYKYGTAADRDPPKNSTIFKVDPTKPVGLTKIKYNFTSDVAKKFVFKATP